MSFLYDLILRLASLYDVRSREFRDAISVYFGSRTAHFQHELYHFMLSGMSMEEYDRVADYPSTSSSSRAGSSSSSSTILQRSTIPPEIITLEDSDDENQSANESRPTLRPRRPAAEGSSNASGIDNNCDIIVVESSSSGKHFMILSRISYIF